MSGPRVSVVIPLREAGPHVEELLAALDAQTLPREEREHLVALAPSPSRDDARTRLEAARRAGRIDGLIDNPAGLAATGLNLAIARADGEIVVRLDARTRPEPDYLAAARTALDRTGAAAVGGAMIPRGRGPWGRAFAALTSGAMGTGGARFRRPVDRDLEVDTVYLGAWRTETLRAAGGFDETLPRNQDDELAARLRARGGRIVLCPDLRSTYVVRERPAEQIAQYFRYGLEKPRALARNAGSRRVRHLAPPLFTLVTIALFAAVVPDATRVAALVALGGILALHATATLALTPGAFADRLRAVPLALGLHLGYGLGFLIGLVPRRGTR